MAKNSPAIAGDTGDTAWTLDWEDPLEEEMATHSSILAWEIQGQRHLAGYSPWGPKRVRHNLATKGL